MITRLEDFLRRRSKISLVVRHEEIRDSDGLGTRCEVTPLPEPEHQPATDLVVISLSR